MTLAALLLAFVVAWALAGTTAAWRRRTTVRHRLAAVRLVGDGGVAMVRRADDLLLVIGRWLLDRRPGGRRCSDLVARRAAACLPLAVAIALGAGPAAGVAAATLALAPALVRERRRPSRARAAAVAGLPDVVDLLAVAARAGLPAPAAVAHIAERAPPPWGPALRAVDMRTSRGDRFVDALDELASVGGAGSGISDPLRAVLRAAADDGADLVGGLDRLAADARDLRRRRAEETARRVPVRLLLPLVACSLPAFALLTIVPIVVGALRDLDL